MNIVVLAGGRSTEREVSINTGYKVSAALMDKGHNVFMADPYFDIEKPEDSDFFNYKFDLEKGLEYIKLNNRNVSRAMVSNKPFFGKNIMELCSRADIVFMALHGEDGENGKVQAAFDLAGIRYTGSGYLGSALAMDKGLSKQLFIQNAVPTPDGTVVRAGVDPAIPEGMGLPMVVKPCCGGSSVGVSIVKTVDEYENALKAALCYETDVIVESYIQGREFSCGVLGNKALPVIEIAPIGGFYDYEHKYIAGMAEEICPAEIKNEIAEKIQEITLNAGKALRLETYYRADFILDEEENLYCLEVNTLPGMTATSLLPQEANAVGIGFGDLCEKIIELSIRKYDGGQ
ncbi:D-alanine--D-alanine ligase [Parasporobacterium paucivorans]|uniref:D-alanine--D-alanine ligase n=1 Tax=Parasporobacterium paucivorans DSM 15970 TaxID=1122934 RepID=A0A1M6AE38_9FIRM|nr:D-alanine--D-alanine ligase [Parasporobacterium paucivorans]SHI34568.1 D-alanine-D-alanine ligase [Parasporobacterium paucivorans DSM 15970]